MESKTSTGECQGIWVFVEQQNGEPARGSLELLGKSRELADKLNEPLTAFLIGKCADKLLDDLIFFGADKVLAADHPLLELYLTETYCDTISKQARKDKPAIILISATPVGRDLAPRLAFRLGAGCTADCTALDIDATNRLLVSTRPAFGGNVLATIVCPEARPQMSTVRPGVFELPKKDVLRRGEVVRLNVDLDETQITVRIREVREADAVGPDIQEAKRIIAVGMGVGDQETLGMIKELAALIGAEIGASRRAVETGWISHDYQVGQTGKTVRPDLYVACGISGAIQHTAGMASAKLVIAINSNPRAEIFKVADYGIVARLTDIIPAVISEVRKRQ